jgi:hypothetical protein
MREEWGNFSPGFNSAQRPMIQRFSLEKPQMRFALLCGFAVSGVSFDRCAQGGALPESRFALGYIYFTPMGFQFAAAQTFSNAVQPFGPGGETPP